MAATAWGSDIYTVSIFFSSSFFCSLALRQSDENSHSLNSKTCKIDIFELNSLLELIVGTHCQTQEII
jgi:hypothetical protein